MRKEVKKFLELSEAAGQDIDICNEMLKNGHLSDRKELFWRRALIRACFAMFEGTIYRMKQTALEVCDEPDLNFSSGEKNILLDGSYNLSDKGEVISVPTRFPLKKNIKFAFYVFAKADSVNYVS